MDNENQKHNHLTAVEEGLCRLSNTILLFEEQGKDIKWYQFKRRYIWMGIMQGLTVTHMMLQELQQYYDNRRGTLN